MKDTRPICNCSAYSFPHKVGGKCNGSSFTEFYFMYVKHCCEFCNCNNGDHCDVATGQESIKYAECHIEFRHERPGEHLPMTIDDII